ncbi:hypothetical protein TCAL_13078 [Tigriopus californicus]|uniref:BHLH domain-containing protein n=1 Tax=Tigriopus californicus TaxID=6832 RepID=A0A553PSZ8_TIGCA|nr:hypothetical protein TCAL_13078 [Tigriopus californicus]|eukprot:TCALIF_13078-PA protein Name:"Similar to neurog1 Neurogenin-1 (Danio rerio)" AED:0.31 eAED:0.31 QI:0/0/0/0.33/1/0.66/3/0/365
MVFFHVGTLCIKGHARLDTGPFKYEEQASIGKRKVREGEPSGISPRTSKAIVGGSIEIKTKEERHSERQGDQPTIHCDGAMERWSSFSSQSRTRRMDPSEIMSQMFSDDEDYDDDSSNQSKVSSSTSSPFSRNKTAGSSGRFKRSSFRKSGRRILKRNPEETKKLKQVRRAKANDRERNRMHMLNMALEKLRLVLPAFPDETKLTKIETLRFANNYIWALMESLTAIEKGGVPPFPPHPGLALELQKSIERGDAVSIGKHALESCAYLAQTMLSQSCRTFEDSRVPHNAFFRPEEHLQDGVSGGFITQPRARFKTQDITRVDQAIPVTTNGAIRLSAILSTFNLKLSHIILVIISNQEIPMTLVR